MRLGGYFGASSIEELPALCEKLDTHGLSAIGAPWGGEIEISWTDSASSDVAEYAIYRAEGAAPAGGELVVLANALLRREPALGAGDWCCEAQRRW